MSQTSNIIEKAENNIIHTYNRYQIVLDKGEGVYLYDAEGKKYLDFGSGIGVFAFGYNNKEYNDAVKQQIDKLVHTSNYFYNEPAADAGEKLVKATGLSKVFFTNSGAEAIEGALKLAKKYGNKSGRSEIIAMEHSFHGRTIGSLSVTGTAHYREAFQPLMPGVHFARYNDFESVKGLVNDKTCAIIMETVQGEGGIHPASQDFISSVRALCDEKDILLILDEVQCGMGRSGAMYAYEKYGVKPDILTTAKALGCGVPIGAFVASEKAADVLTAGDHGTTYGGNPLACAAVAKVFELFEKNNVLENVNNVGEYLYQRLEEMKNKYSDIADHRGMGLIQGLEFDKPVAQVINRLLDAGVITFAAGTNVIRFIPPLIITKAHVDEMIDKLMQCL